MKLKACLATALFGALIALPVLGESARDHHGFRNGHDYDRHRSVRYETSRHRAHGSHRIRVERHSHRFEAHHPRYRGHHWATHRRGFERGHHRGRDFHVIHRRRNDHHHGWIGGVILLGEILHHDHR